MAQGIRKAMYGMDAGAKYDMSKKASLSLNVRDVFSTRKWQMTTGSTLLLLILADTCKEQWPI
jgi:uncharacterized protein with beta-barrel porin domain